MQAGEWPPRGEPWPARGEAPLGPERAPPNPAYSPRPSGQGGVPQAAAALFGGFPTAAAGCWRQQVRFGRSRDLLTSELLKGRIGLLVSGLALRQRVLRRGEHGERQTLDIYLPGDVIGIETAYLGANAAEVRALSPLVVAVADLHSFTRALAMPGFAESVVEILAQQQRRLENRIVRLTRLGAESRIAAFFLDILHRLGCPEEGLCMHLSLTQRDLADLLGLTPVHVNRVLHRLADRGILSFQRGAATVHDPAALRCTACENGAYCGSVLGL
jgi:CRP-like cAMP-binding protein